MTIYGRTTGRRAVRGVAAAALCAAAIGVAGGGRASAAPDGTTVYVSSTANGKVRGMAFADEDIVAYDTETDAWSLAFDGSDVGLAAADIDAFDIVSLDPTAVIDFSIDADRAVGALGTVDDSDVVRFTGIAGAATSGTLALLIDGSDLGLTTAAEDVDALAASGTGFAWSTGGNVTVAGAKGGDEDLVLLDPVTTGPDTSGTMALLFDGSDVGLTPSDVTGIWIDPVTGDIYAAATNPWTVSGLTGDGDDVFAFRGTTGANTSGTATKFFDGDLHGFNFAIDGLHVYLAPLTPAPRISTPPAATVPENRIPALDVDATDPDADPITYSITGGADAARFTIDPVSGLLSFASAPDFEAPVDTGTNNVYDVQVTATDTTALTDARDFAITVTNVDLPVSFGGAGHDVPVAIALDAAGGAYVAGTFTGSVDFDPGPGTSTLTASGVTDPFVVRLDPDGGLVWARSFSGSDEEIIGGLAVSTNGSVLLVGDFTGTFDVDPGAGVTTLVSNGDTDGFLVSLTAGGALGWARDIGDSGADSVRGVATDATNNVIVTGWFADDVDIDPGAGVTVLSSLGERDALVAKYTSAGALTWGRSFGGIGIDNGAAVTVDGAGRVYVTGSFSDVVDFDPNAGIAELTASGTSDGYVSKLTANGTLTWARPFGGPGTNLSAPADIAVDAAGNVVTAGRFTLSSDFDPGPAATTLYSKGDTDAFVWKLDANGNLAWARSLGGTGADGARDVAVDAAGNVFWTGQYRGSVDLDPGPDTFTRTAVGADDAFVTKLYQGGVFDWTRSFGSADPDSGTGIVVGSDGWAWIAGTFTNTIDFDPGPALRNRSAVAGLDVFVSRLDTNGDIN